jgi:hypothetical protein
MVRYPLKGGRRDVPGEERREMAARICPAKNPHGSSKLLITGFMLPLSLGCALAYGDDSGGTPISIEPADTKAMEYNTPGHYSFSNKCAFMVTMSVEGGGPSDPVPEFRATELWICVDGVLVEADLTMRFDIKYTLSPADPEAGPVWRNSDRGNKNIYLTDDKGGRYEVEDLGGCAAGQMWTEKEDLICTGWFLFPPAEPGARLFEFHYATVNTTEGGGSVEGIELTDPD